MKKLEAIIKPTKVGQIKQALMDMGVRGIITTDVKGFGREFSHAEVFRGSRQTVDFIPEVKMEIILQDAQLEAATAILSEATGAGDSDEGSVLLVPVESAFEHAAS